MHDLYKISMYMMIEDHHIIVVRGVENNNIELLKI